METIRHIYGIDFSSDEVDLNTIRLTDLFAIAFNKLCPDAADMPTAKEISILIMNKEIKRVEIIKNRQNKYVFDARFYY